MSELRDNPEVLYGAAIASQRFTSTSILNDAPEAIRDPYTGKTWKPHKGNVASGYIWKYAQQVGDALHGAVTHPGGAAEKSTYADI